MSCRGENLNHFGAGEPFLAQGFPELGEAPDGHASEHDTAQPTRIGNEYELSAKLKLWRLLNENCGSQHTLPLPAAIRQRVREALTLVSIKPSKIASLATPNGASGPEFTVRPANLVTVP